MDTAEFETGLKRDGYADIETKKVPGNIATKPHAHDFSVQELTASAATRGSRDAPAREDVGSPSGTGARRGEAPRPG